jgi:hypothetical protein
MTLAALASLTVVCAGDALAAKKTKKGCATVRDCMSEEQKAALRKRSREYCLKHHGNVHRVEINSKGQAICWYVQ